MNVINTEIEGVYIIEPKIFKDNRGYFYESYSDKEFRQKIGAVNFIQDNQSKSSYGVLRGLHFQKGEHSQAKLLRCISGEVLDIAVDLRRDSSTFGQYVSCILTEDNFRQFYIPRGFAHGFVVLSETALFQYKCDNYYAPESEGGIAWDDPEIHIDWQICVDDIILSEKDKHHPNLRDGYHF